MTDAVDGETRGLLARLRDGNRSIAAIGCQISGWTGIFIGGITFTLLGEFHELALLAENQETMVTPLLALVLIYAQLLAVDAWRRWRE